MIGKKRVNELGEKSGEESYVCRVCRREVTKDTAEREEWYYNIKTGDDIKERTSNTMKYFNPDNVEYVCNEHFRTLPDKESREFIQIGYPYYASVLINARNFFSF